MRRSFSIAGFFVLPLMLAVTSCATAPGTIEEGKNGNGLKGYVISKEDGGPVAGAYVYAYVDPAKNLIGVADYVSKGSATDGSYRLELPPGNYYVVARKRGSGANYGPIVTGDMYDHRYEHDPVRIGTGGYLVMDFSLVELSEPLFFQVFNEPERRTGTGVKGRILDRDGVPVQGAFATAYRDGNMKRLPDFVSTLSGDDGAYVLYLPEGGKWFLGARTHARGVPKAGELVGRYGGSPDHSLEVPPEGFVEGVEFTLEPFTSEPPAGYVPY